MAHCSRTEDLGDWEVLSKDEFTAQQVSPVDISLQDDESMVRAVNGAGESVRDDGGTTQAGSNAGESIHGSESTISQTKRDHDPHMHPNASKSTKEPEDMMIGNESKGQTKGLYLENIYVPPGYFQVDVKTESGRVKGSGRIAELLALSEAVVAQNIEGDLANRLLCAESKVGEDIDDNSLGQQEHKQDHVLPIRTTNSSQPQYGNELPESDHYSPVRVGRISNSLPQAIRDEETKILSLENGAHANSKYGWENPLMCTQEHKLKEAFSQGLPVSSFDSGQITIKGFFPAGTNLEIVTREGSRQIIATEQPLIAHSVSAGNNTFQFIGDSKHISALLRGQARN